jgi:hypothetical protein
MYKGLTVAVVVPSRDDDRPVEDVVSTMPAIVDHILVVDRGRRGGSSAAAVVARDPRCELITPEHGGEPGAAVAGGYRRALELGADISAVMGDGRIDPTHLLDLIDPLADRGFGLAQGNRFFAFGCFDGMPRRRVLGNVLLSFLTKAASGYWQLPDPQNGWTALTRDALARIPLDRLRAGHGFESDLLVQLNIARVRAVDVPIPARFGADAGGIASPRDVRRTVVALARGFWHRIWWKYVVQSFSPVALLLFTGLALVAIGGLVGVFVLANTLGPATASPGTVLLSAAPLLSGFHLIVSSLLLDIQESQR